VAEPVCFYPTRTSAVLGVITIPGLTALMVAIAIGEFGRPTWQETVCGVIVVVASPFLLFSTIRQVVSPRPLLRLDHRAIEGSWGRVEWPNIERVEVRNRHWQFGWWLVLWLKPLSPDPEPPHHPVASWLFTGRSRLLSNRVEFGLAKPRRDVIGKIEHFYHGPIRF
jgi:hypothetical protein